MTDVEFTQRADGTGSLLIDGVDYAHLIAKDGVVIYSGDPGSAAKVEIQIPARLLTRRVTGADVRVDEKAHDLLLCLGWTPPSAGAR